MHGKVERSTLWHERRDGARAAARPREGMMGSEIAPDRVEARGGSFTSAVQTMFDGLAPQYDTFNRWASLGLDEGWRRKAIKRLQMDRGWTVLDVATGTGDLALAAERAGARVIGCDFARVMIGLARAKAAESQQSAARFLVSRAEELPYPDASFEGASSAFAMRNVRPMLDDVLSEMHRVLLRPGGRVVILEFSDPRGLVRWGHRLYTGVLVPIIGRVLTGSGEPFSYLNRSIDAWLSPEEFAERLRAAGFEDVGFERLTFGTVALHWGRRSADL